MKAVRRKITPVGLGDRSGPADAGGLVDADRVVIGEAGEFRAWSGMRRTWEKVLKEALHGAATGDLRILRGSQTVVDRHTGHLLVVADDATANRGRVLAVAHHPSGLLGTNLAGAAVQTTGSGLDDLSVRDYFDGATGGLFVVTIATAATPDTFNATLDGASVASGVAITGDWQQVGTTGLWIKFAATTGHTAADAWKIVAGGRPCIAGSLNRLNAHHYPTLAPVEGKTIVAHAFDVAHVDDGTAVRELGLPTPRLAPTLNYDVQEAAPNTAANIGYKEDFNDGAIATFASAADVVLGTDTEVDGDIGVAEGARAAHIYVPQRMWGGGFDLCWDDLAAPATIPATTTTIKFWLLIKERAWRRNPLEEGTLEVVVASEVALGGDRIVLPVAQKLYGYRWYEIDVPWTRQTSFVAASIGFRIGAGLVGPSWDEQYFDVFIDDIRIDSGEVVEGEDGRDSVPTSEVFGEGTGEWVAAFTWANPERRLESGMSPASKPLKGNGAGFVADLSGWYPEIPTGLANAVPEGATHAHLYLANTLWGPDPQTGGYQWRRVSPIEGIPVDTLSTGAKVGAVTDPDAPDDNTGNGSVVNLQAKPGAPAETWTLLATSATNFTVTGSVTGLLTAEPITVGTPYQNDYFSLLIQAGATPFVAGDDFSFAITTTEHGNGRLIVRLTDPKTEAEMLASEPGPWFNGRPPGANIVVPVGRRVILADLPGVEFDATLTADSPIVTLSGLAAGEWMEGRRFQVLGESRTYWVLKATSTTQIHIVENFDPNAESGGAYDGTSGTKRCRIVAEKDSFVWTNITARRGVDCENASPLANYNFPGSAFVVGGIVRVGSFLWVIHRWGFGAYIFRIAEEAKDDMPANGMAFSDPDFMKDVSCISQRSIVEVAPGQAYWIGARGEVWYAVGGQAQVLPGPSAMMRGILAGRGIVLSASGLVDCHGVVVSEGADRYIVWVFRQSAEAVENASGDVGVEPRSGDPLAMPTDVLVGGNWPPSNAEMVTTHEADATVWDLDESADVLGWPMHEIPGLAGGGRNYEGDSFFGVSYGAGAGDPAEGYDKTCGWVHGSGAYFARQASVASGDGGGIDHLEWSVGDVSGAKTPAQNSGIMATPTTNRNLPATKPSAYTDLTNAVWDAIAPVKGKVTAITTLIEGQTGTTLPAQWNNITQIHGWKGAEPNGLGYGDAVAAVLRCPGVRLTTKATWAVAPSSPVPVAVGRVSGSSVAETRVLDAGATIRGRIYVEGASSQTLPSGAIRLIFRNTTTSLSESDTGYSHEDDVAVVIAEAIPTNTWTDYEVTLAADQINGTWTDRDGVSRDGVIYKEIVLCIATAIPEATFNQTNNDLRLFFALGHQVPNPAVAESTLPPKECRGDADLETDAVGGDFDTAVRLRIADPPSAWIATECPVTAFDRERHEACSTDGRLTGAPIFGDRHGFVGLGPEAGWLPWFGPEARIVWSADPDGAGSTTVFNVQRDQDGGLDVLSLPVDPDGTGILVGLLCAKVTRDSDGQYRRWESRRIASNTAGAVTVASAWTAAPTINDRLLIAPMVEMVHLPEIRTTFFSSLRALALNLDDQTRPGNANTFPVLFRLEQFEGATDAIQADNATPTATAWFNSTDLRTKREISIPAKSSKARSYRLTWIGRETGACTVRNLVLTETMHEAEGGR